MAAKVNNNESLTVGVDNVLRKTVAIITEAILPGDKVHLPNLGTFRKARRTARKGVNPRTGKRMTIPEAVVPKFSAPEALKEAVKG